MSGRGKVTNSWLINIIKSFLQGDSYAPVGFCLTEVPITVLLEETSGYKMGQPGQRNIKRMRSLFVDSLNVYQESYHKLEIVNEIILKASMNTGACSGMKKCAKIVFRD